MPVRSTKPASKTVQPATRPKGPAVGKTGRSRGHVNKPAVPTPQPKLVTHAGAVIVRDGTVQGLCSTPAPAQGLGLLLNGTLIGTAPVKDGGAFSFNLPGSILAGTLDVVTIPDGVSILPGGIAVPSGIEWLGWAVTGLHITGSFRCSGEAGSAPILVQAYADGQLMLQTFATAIEGADGAFGFDGVVRRLIEQDKPITLRPCLNGGELDIPLTLEAKEAGITGYLDASEMLEACGWAADLTNGERRVEIDIRVDGHPIGRITAEIFRPDLQELELSDGRSGFTLPLPADLDRRKPISIHAYLAGTETELLGSPYILAPLPSIIGFFDALEGPFAGGWAINVHDPDTPLAVEAVCDGEVIGTGLANLYRGDVEQAGMPTPWCGFRFALERPLKSLLDRDIALRISGSDHHLRGSPRQISQNSNIVGFLTRSKTIPAPRLERFRRSVTYRTRGTLISIIMPVYNTKREWLIEALNSALLQWSANWELIVVNDGSTEPHVAELLALVASHDARVRVIHAPGNGGIAAATNLGLRAARGAYVAFMDHDDIIEPDAVYKLAMAAQTTGADFIYSDEAITTDDIDSVVEVRARPAFSHDYYLSHPYFVHLVCVRTDLAQQIQGWDERLPISADVDFILRAIERANAIAHVPSVLYRWRTHGESAGHAKMEEVTVTMKGVLARHLARSNLPATVSDGFRYNEYRLDWPDDGGEVLIVIPTKNRVDLLRTCIESIERTVGAPDGPGHYRIVVIDHDSTDRNTLAYLKRISGRHTVMPYSGMFNYALMNNLAVRVHGGAARHFLFLNNDVEAFEIGWLQRLRSLCARPDIGAVGPLLLYGDRRVQHAGVLMAFSGAAEHAMKFQQAYLAEGERHPGYNCNLTSVRDYSAVTAACVMIRRDVFKRVGGFDESFVVGFNDTDLCLRILEAGYRVIYDGFTVLYHHESATRTENRSVEHPEDDLRLRQRWTRFFRNGDPFYSPLLAMRGTDHTLRQDRGYKGLLNVRVVVRPRAELAVVPVQRVRRAERAASKRLVSVAAD